MSDDEDVPRYRRGRGRRRRDEDNDDSVMNLPVVSAAYYGSVDAVVAALREGGDVEELDPKDGWRPLHAAVMTESVDVAEYLLRSDAQINSTGPYGMTPLHIACRDNSFEMVRFLLAARADAEAVDTEGRSAAQICVAQGSTRAHRVLLNPNEPDEQPPETDELAPRRAPATQPPPLFTSAPLMTQVRCVVSDEEAPATQTPADLAGAAAPAAPWFGSAVDPDREYEEEPEWNRD